jgi:hypothetical protein
MRRLRDALDQVRAQKNCPAQVYTPGPRAGREEPAVGPRVSESDRTEPAKPTKPRRHGPGLAVGVGVSAALTIGMAIGTGVLYSQLRKDGGRYYKRVQEAAVATGVPSTDAGVDMCEMTGGRPALGHGVPAMGFSAQGICRHGRAHRGFRGQRGPCSPAC